MQATQSPTSWRKSSYSSTSKECVEVADGPITGVRDTQHRDGVMLELPAASWDAFLRVL